MSRINVAQMIFSKAIGGAEAVAREIAHHLDKSKFNVVVIANDEISSHYEGCSVTVLPIGKLSKIFPKRLLPELLSKVCPSVFPRTPALPSAVQRVTRVLEDYQIDALHTHLWLDQYLASTLPKVAAKQVMTVHGVVDLDTRVRHPRHPALLRRVLSSADRLTSACRYFVDRLEAHGIPAADRTSIIENGIQPELTEAKREPVRADERLTMTFLGGTRPAKGGELLIEALAIVVSEIGSGTAHVDVLREVPPGSVLYSLIQRHSLQDHVSLVGYVPDNDHLRFISRNKLFVLPSLTEGVANTLMEAIGLDKAILATAVGGTPEVVTHDHNGYLCEPTAESLADGILFFIRHPEKLQEYSAANRRLKARFFWPTVIKRYEELYTSLMEPS